MSPNITQHQNKTLQDNQRLKLAIDMLLDYWLQPNSCNSDKDQKQDDDKKTNQGGDKAVFQED